jgi:hypothetical protein
MREMIDARRAVPNLEEKHDLFSRLIDASQTEKDGASMLSDTELMGLWIISPVRTQLTILSGNSTL